MRRATFPLAVVFGLSMTSSLSAQTTTLNFDELTAAPTYFSGNFIPTNARLSTGYLSTYGVKFSSTGGYAGVVPLGSGHATSGLNGLSGSTTSNTISYSNSDPILVTFFNPAAITVPAVTDFVSVRGDLMPDGGLLTLSAYDLSGNLLTSDTELDAGGTLLSVSAIGIHSVVIRGSGSTAFDDFTFHSLTPVPEYHSMLLVGTMAGLVCEIRRRITKRRKQV